MTTQSKSNLKALVFWLVTSGSLLGAVRFSITTRSDVDTLKAEVPAKVDTAEFRRELRLLNAKMDEIGLRQQQFFCDNKPRFCR